jgi:hypothetical protein
MTGRYVERAADPLRAVADQVAGRVAAAMDGREAPVVSLERNLEFRCGAGRAVPYLTRDNG